GDSPPVARRPGSRHSRGAEDTGPGLPGRDPGREGRAAGDSELVPPPARPVSYDGGAEGDRTPDPETARLPIPQERCVTCGGRVGRPRRIAARNVTPA